MNLQETKEFCKKHNIKPKRKSGQNFLIDNQVLEKIIKSANLSQEDIVLEVGPGLGFLTKELAKKAKKIIAIEIDKELVKALKETLAGFKNVEIMQGDILNFRKSDFRQITKIVANLPYNITSYFLRIFLGGIPSLQPKTDPPRAEIPPFREGGRISVPMTLMLQKEVAERICAKPSSADSGPLAGQMSILSVSVQFYAEPKIVGIVDKSSFWPSPEIDSAIINIKPWDNYLRMLYAGAKNPSSQSSPFNKGEGGLSEKDFFRIVKFGFSARRKQLQNNLASGLKMSSMEIKRVLEKVGINPLARAQELSVEQWIDLAKKLI